MRALIFISILFHYTWAQGPNDEGLTSPTSVAPSANSQAFAGMLMPGSGGVVAVVGEQSDQGYGSKLSNSFQAYDPSDLSNQGFPSILYSPTVPDDIDLDENWYLNNPAVPRALKEVLQLNEDALEGYTYSMHLGCTYMLENSLEKFITEEISPLINARPQFCQALTYGEKIEQQMVFLPKGSGQSNFGQDEVNVLYQTVEIDPTAIENPEALSEIDKIYLDLISDKVDTALSIPQAVVDDQGAVLEEMSEYLPMGQHMNNLPPAELIQTMLLRLWPALSGLDQMRIIRNCNVRYAPSINNNAAFWQLNDTQEQSPPNYLSQAIEICNAENYGDLIKYIDNSIMAEYAIYRQNSNDSLSDIIKLCGAWPEATLSDQVQLPPTTREQVLFNASEAYRQQASQRENIQNAISLFNSREFLDLPEHQKNALIDYTGSNYNAINAYQMWGRIGLWALDSPAEQSREYLRENIDPPSAEEFDSVEQYNAALEQYELMLRIGMSPPNWREMSDEEKREFLDETSGLITRSGTTIPVAAQNLREALEGMNHFTGVTFSAQSLNGHFLTRIRPGRTFSPGFFMSTSTNQTVSQGFLGDVEADDSTRYLFVIKNRTGAPIVNYSMVPSESEVLVHPNAEFTILDVEDYEIDGETYPHIQVVYLEENP